MNPTREQRIKRATELWADGWTGVQIAKELGVAKSTAYELLNDPDLSKSRARKDRYATDCIDCGARTNGSSGFRRQAVRCSECHLRKQHEDAYWTRERIIQAIREWTEHFGGPPSATNWNSAAKGFNAAKFGTGTYPITGTVQYVFGSWANGIEAAGFPRPQPTGRPPGSVTEAERQHALALQQKHGLTKAAQLLGITPNGLYQRILPLRAKGKAMPQYSASTAIERDADRVRERIKVLEAEIEERKAYLAALEAAKKALNGNAAA